MTQKQEDKLSMWSTTDKVLTNYQEVWKNLPGFVGASKLFRVIRSQIDPNNVAEKLAEGMIQLEIMDDLVGNFKRKHPEFVSAYHSARMIINHGGRSKPKNPPPSSNP